MRLRGRPCGAVLLGSIITFVMLYGAYSLYALRSERTEMQAQLALKNMVSDHAQQALETVRAQMQSSMDELKETISQQERQVRERDLSIMSLEKHQREQTRQLSVCQRQFDEVQQSLTDFEELEKAKRQCDQDLAMEIRRYKELEEQMAESASDGAQSAGLAAANKARMADMQRLTQERDTAMADLDAALKRADQAASDREAAVLQYKEALRQRDEALRSMEELKAEVAHAMGAFDQLEQELLARKLRETGKSGDRAQDAAQPPAAAAPKPAAPKPAPPKPAAAKPAPPEPAPQKPAAPKPAPEEPAPQQPAPPAPAAPEPAPQQPAAPEEQPAAPEEQPAAPEPAQPAAPEPAPAAPAPAAPQPAQPAVEAPSRVPEDSEHQDQAEKITAVKKPEAPAHKDDDPTTRAEIEDAGK